MDWIAFGSMGLTLVFGVLSVIFYAKARRHKRLTLTSKEVLVQTKDHPEVNISFRGHQVESLWRLRAVCWNSGTDAIRVTDVPEGQAIRITLPENARCLSAVLLDASHADFQIQQQDDRNLQVNFTYLNPGEWGAIEALYDGDPTDTCVIPPLTSFSAPLIGGLLPMQRSYTPFYERWPARIVPYLPVVIMPLWAIWSRQYDGKPLLAFWTCLAASAITSASSMALFARTRRHRASRSVIDKILA